MFITILLLMNILVISSLLFLKSMLNEQSHTGLEDKPLVVDTLAYLYMIDIFN